VSDQPARRLHIRALSRNEENNCWNAIGETDDGEQVEAPDFWGVQDVGGGISAAMARGVELRVSEAVYAEMNEYGHSWFPARSS
jgi:hypothetical protein